MNYRIELADRSFNVLEYLEKEAMGVSWEYARIGGCGSFSFDLPRELCNEKYISGDFNVKIKRRNPATGAYDLWYQGIVERKEPSLRGARETVQVTGHGYFAQLGRIRLTETYSSTEISVIVKDILDTYVTPNTDITYDAGDIEATSFTPDTLEFKNVTALEALQTCAETAGGVEYGVDRNRKFIFKARSTTVNFLLPASGGKLRDYSYEDDFSAIVNQVFIQGGDVSGSPFTYSVPGDGSSTLATVSQLKYGRRDRVIQNSAIVTNAVAQQFADTIFAEFSDVVRRGRGRLVDYEDLIEDTTPLGLFQAKVRGTTYGEKHYGTFLYSGPISFQIDRITYSINKDSDLEIGLTLGELRPDEAEYISRLENRIEAIRTAGL